MAYPNRVNFVQKIYKDQTVGGGANTGVVIAPGDTVYLKKKGVNGTEVLETVTVTGVHDEGHTVEWDAGTTGVRNEDIVGISAKHQYKCAGSVQQQFTVTEGADADTVPMELTDVVISGGTETPSTPVVESEAADGIEEQFVEDFIAYLNGVLAGTGAYASASAITGAVGSQAFTVTITGNPLRVEDVNMLGATVGTITNS